MKIMNYNIHKGKNIKNKSTLDDMIKYFNHSDIDILCLQEVLRSDHEKIMKNTNLKGYYQCNVNLKLDDYGISIYVKRNIDVSFVEENFLTSKKEQRGFINLKAYINNKLVNIINTHLGLDEVEREIQIEELIRYTENLRGKIFLCGDFNEKDVYIDLYYDSARVFGCEYVETFAPSKSRIDYIFVSNNINLNKYKVNFIDLSDHYPLYVEFNI